MTSKPTGDARRRKAQRLKVQPSNVGLRPAALPPGLSATVRQGVLGLAVGFGCGLAGFGAMAQDVRGITRSEVAGPLPPAVLTIDPARLHKERTDNAVVDATRRALGTTGAFGGPVREIGLREAALAALDHNLAIRRSGIAEKVARQALQEAEALFDPVFVASASDSRTSARRRTETADRFHPATERVPVGQADSTGTAACNVPRAKLSKGDDNGNACYFVVIGKGKPVEFLQFDQYRPAGNSPSTVVANDPAASRPHVTNRQAALLAVYQQLPWGGVLDGSMATNRQQAYYSFDEVSDRPVSYGSYGRPWSSSLAVGATLPLPYSKNFGPYAAAETSGALATLDIAGAELDTRAVVNTTLLQVETAYWALVSAVQRLNAAAETAVRAEEMRGHIRRMVEARQLTEADRAQADSNVARVRAAQQRILGELAAASEALRELTAGSDAALFVPVGYRVLLDRPAAMTLDPARTIDNPSYRRTAVGVQIATLIREQREAQTRPDLLLRADASGAQAPNPFGFQTVTRSLARLLRPDQVTATFRLLYQYPWGNRAATAGLERAVADEQRQTILLEQVDNQIREDFESARLQLASAQERSRLAGRNVELEQAMYDRVVRLQAENLITPYETLARLNSLLDARTAQIQANIDARMVQARLLASVGALPERYGERTAQTSDDRLRTAGLRESGWLRIFGGPL